jgi:Holliday junction resolvasome RuvABC endonuclease subunit
MIKIRNDILAVDPSLKATGYCRSLSDYGTFRFSQKSSTCQDIGQLYNGLSDLITLPGSIKYIIKENYALGYHNSGMTRIMEIGGILQLLAFQHNLTIIAIAPTSIKKIISGTGTGRKEAVMREINDLLGLNIKDDNISDALAIYLVGCGYLDEIERKQLPNTTKVADLSSDIAKSYLEFKDGMLRQRG